MGVSTNLSQEKQRLVGDKAVRDHVSWQKDDET